MRLERWAYLRRCKPMFPNHLLHNPLQGPLLCYIQLDYLVLVDLPVRLAELGPSHGVASTKETEPLTRSSLTPVVLAAELTELYTHKRAVSVTKLQ